MKNGFSVGFGGHDEGMAAAMGTAQSAIDNINKSLSQQNSIVKRGGVGSAFKNMASTMGRGAKNAGSMAAGIGSWAGDKMRNRVNSFNLANISSGMRSLTGDASNLTSQIEGMMVSYAQTAKPILSNLGLEGKELQKMTAQASSMAYGLNVGVDTVTKTMAELKLAGTDARKVLDSIGFTTSEWVKFSEVTGMSVENVGSIGGQLVSGWGMAGDQAKKLMEFMTAMGQKGGVGSQMLTGMAEFNNQMGETFQNLPAQLQPTADQMQKLFESSARLAGAYRQMGLTAEESANAARQTTGQFAKWGAEWQKFKLTGEGEVDAFYKLSALLGDATKAEEIMNKATYDSVGAMQQFSSAIQQAGASGKQLDATLVGEFQEALGGASGQAVWLAMNAETGSKALDDMANASVNAAGSLNKLQKEGFTTGLTLADGLERSKERFQQTLRNLTRKDVRGFVKEQKNAWGEFGKDLKKNINDKTLGPLIKVWSTVDQMGSQGLFLSIAKQMGRGTTEANKFAVQAEIAMGLLEKTQTAMAPFMETLGMFGPLGAAAGGLMLWFSLDSAQQDAILSMVRPVWERIKEWFSSIWYSDETQRGIEQAASALGTALKSVIDWAGLAADFLSGIDWKLVFSHISVGMNAAFGDSMFGKLLGLKEGAEKGEKYIEKAAKMSEWRVSDKEAWRKEREQKTASLGNLLPSNVSTGYFTGVQQSQDPQDVKDAINKLAQMSYNEANRVAPDFSVRETPKIGREEAIKSRTADDIGLFGTSIRTEAEKAADEANTEMWSITKMWRNLADESMIKNEQMRAERKSKDLATTDVQRAAKEQNTLDLEAFRIIKRQQEVDASTWLTLSADRPSLEEEGVTPSSSFQQIQSAAQQAGVSMEDFLPPEAEMKELAVKAAEGGVSLMDAIVAGMAENKAKTGEGIKKVLASDVLPFLIGNSPPAEGPLSGDVLPGAGRNIMMTMLAGMEDARFEFQDGFAMILEEAAVFAIDAFHAKALAEMEKDKITWEILGDITDEFGGDLLTGEDKKVLKESLDMSGMYGVISALVYDGAATRKVLTDIEMNTHGMRGFSPGGKGGWDAVNVSGRPGDAGTSTKR